MAIESFSASLAAVPTDGAFFHRGNAYASLGKYQEAIADYTEVIKINSTNDRATKAYNNRGMAHVKIGDNEEAIADWERVVAMGPDTDMGRRAVANIRSLRAELEEWERRRVEAEVAQRVTTDEYGSISVSVSIDEWKKLHEG